MKNKIIEVSGNRYIATKACSDEQCENCAFSEDHELCFSVWNNNYECLGIFWVEEPTATPRTHPATPDPRTGWTKEQPKIGDRVLIEGEVYSTSKLLAYIRINDGWNIEVPISDIKQILP